MIHTGKNNMETPWGLLHELDPHNPTLACEILSTDKHQLVEGLVVESLFDQIIGKLPSVGNSRDVSLDVETIVVQVTDAEEPWIAFVWARARQSGLRDYLRALEQGFATYLLKLHEGYFYATRVRDGHIDGKDTLPLHHLVTKLGYPVARPSAVDPRVRDYLRQQQAFWGFLSAQYGRRLWDDVVMPRLLINHGIQPHFRAVWNLDRVFIYDGKIWLGEIKHKFPFGQYELSFGMNVGELNVIERLTAAGIQCLHLVLVKPVWSKDQGSMYLLNELEMRSRAALIACVLNDENLSSIFSADKAVSGNHTSFTGSSNISYRKVKASQFSLIGTIGDKPPELAAGLGRLMRGEQTAAVSDARLRQFREGQAADSRIPRAAEPQTLQPSN